MSFDSGFQMGTRMADNAMSQLARLREERRRDEAHATAQERDKLVNAGLRRVDDATNALSLAANAGVRNATGIKANDDEFEFANALAAQGIDVPKYDPAQASQEWRPASEREMTRLALGLAAARGDAAGVSGAQDRMRKFDIEDVDAKVAKAPMAELEKLLPQLNTNQSQYPMLYTGKGKNGYSFLTTDPDGTPGKALTMTEAQVRQLARSHFLAQAGFGTESLASLSAANKEIGEHVARWNDVTAKANTVNNTAAYYSNTDDYRRGMLGATSARLNMDKMGTPVQMLDAQGNAVVGIPVMGRNGMEFRRMETGGLRFPKQVDPAAVEKRAAALIGTPTGGLVNGKPEVFTPESAYPVAQRQLMNQGEPDAGLPVVAAPPRGAADSRRQPPVPRPALVDEDGLVRPSAGRTVNTGYGTIDARGLLRTPSYSANPTRFAPE